MDINAVINAEIELLTAIKNADVPALERLLHPDLLFNLPDGQTITKQFDLDSYRSGKMKIEVLEASDQLINIIGDAAVVSVLVLLKGNYDNQPVNGVYRYLRVWKKSEANMQVIAGSCVSV
jgi:ketosteroid isomerase-like protein